MTYGQETIAVHPQRVDPPAGNRPLVAPIYQSVKYTPRNMAHLRDILADRSKGYIYSRVANPTVRELEILLANLQGKEDALCVGSGIAAIAAATLALVAKDDHVLMFRESYKPTRYLQKNILGKFGVRTSVVGLEDVEKIREIFSSDPPKLVLIESPTNPVLRIPDLEAMSSLCRKAGSLLILDNTFAGFHHHGDLDIDLYIHSLTKHACGHSDAMGGVIIGSQKLIDLIFPTAITLGATLDPHAASLILRGMKTYSLRVAEASKNAAHIHQWLKTRRGIKNLRYPADPSHPDYKTWLKQMKGDGGSVISFDIDGDTAQTDLFIDSLKLFALTPSMGCVESLVAPCLCLFADDFSEADARLAGISSSTVRLAVGIENVHDLTRDLDQALVACGFN